MRFGESTQGANMVGRHHVGMTRTKEASRGYPPRVHFLTDLVMIVWCLFHQSCPWLWSRDDRVMMMSPHHVRSATKRSDSLSHIRCLLVDMKYQGLVDPKDKPFGRVLPFEVQVKIMFWVECFVTVDQRKKVLQEFKGLPKCDVTGLPQHLGQDQWWNQVVVRFHVPKTTHCHHCHRIFDHKLSVSERGDGICCVHS